MESTGEDIQVQKVRDMKELSHLLVSSNTFQSALAWQGNQRRNVSAEVMCSYFSVWVRMRPDAVSANCRRIKPVFQPREKNIEVTNALRYNCIDENLSSHLMFLRWKEAVRVAADVRLNERTQSYLRFPCNLWHSRKFLKCFGANSNISQL